ncbi:MAG: glucosyl-3-phosphoglycerate synthase [Anaerolineae bacterium]
MKNQSKMFPSVGERVSRWFSEKSFHAADYKHLEQLLAAKEAKGLTISVALPALNEADTIGDILGPMQDCLMEKIPLIDEIVVVDSDSVDSTRDIARAYGVPVYVHQELLTNYGVRAGKGEALWKSLYVTTGDIVLWCDTDIKNFHPRFIYGLLGPLLADDSVEFVKGFYRRPISADGSGKPRLKAGGGRVTELTARPLLNMFFPELSGFIQPLAGEYGGRRSLLEKLTFTSGYGVEVSLLIDALHKAGLNKLAQVNLIERIHHNQPLEDLSKMSFAVMQTVFQQLEQKYGRSKVGELNRFLNLSMRRAQLELGHEEMTLESEHLIEHQRPPMNTISEYITRYNNPEMPLTGIKSGNLLRDVLGHPDDIFLIPGSFVSRS